MEEILIKSTLDGTEQPSLFYFSGQGKPLLVGLHTWSFNRKNQVSNMLPYAEKYGWNLLLPEFRGANKASNPNCREACGSPLAVQDVFDAIEYVSEKYKIDRTKIFLLGASGGGHMALMVTAKNPELFLAVGSFVPITDLLGWHEYSKGYAPHIEACLGGEPNEENIADYKARSPISYVDELSRANLKIFHGKFDSTVPFTHSTSLYNLICEKHPKSRVYLDIFDGGHEMNMETAFRWLLSQMKDEQAERVTG